MNERRDLPAGPFATWLRDTRLAHQNDTAVDVPCGECVACCRSSYFIHVGSGETETLSRIPAELLVAAPGLPRGHVVMGYDEKGRCPMLREGRCSIYQHRPLTCRTYDCRVFAASGIAADRQEITARSGRWKFDHPTEDDHAALSAVRAAARFLRGHPECFVGGPRADNPAHVALLALKVFEVFLVRGDGPGAPGRASSDDDIVKAVMAAHERFEAGRKASGAGR